LPESSPEQAQPEAIPPTGEGVPHLAKIRRDVDTVAGEEMSQVTSTPEETASPSVIPMEIRTENTENLSGAYKAAEDKLRSIEDLANKLAQKSIKHSMMRFWDYIPIAGNVRSHKIATSEAGIILEIKGEVAELESLVKDNGLELEIGKLADLAGRMKPPKGFKKLLASILLFPRGMHREVVSPWNDKLQSMASDLRRQAQQKSRAPQRKAA